MAQRLRRSLPVIGLVLLLGVLSGCSSAVPMVSVLRGNLAFGRGDYQAALVHYLSTEEAADDRGWVLFNSGNVYYALGEQEAALSSWDEAREVAGVNEGRSSDSAVTRSLIHAASYNRGVLFYQRGDYRDAYDEFRYALSVDSQSIAAKANLELALQKIRSAEQAEQTEPAGGSGAPDGDADEAGPATLRILEYVRRKEIQRWFANREADESGDPRDW